MEIPFGNYVRRFTVGGQNVETKIKITSKRMRSWLFVDGVEIDSDETPNSGVEAIRNHMLDAPLADGRPLSVEAGYIGWTTAGIIARIDGEVIHESHPGKTVAYPQSAVRMTTMEVDKEAQKANRIPIAIDIAFGLIFFVIGYFYDITTAAIVGAVLGVGLLVAQRFVSVNIVGGLALFGTVMLVVSAGFALVFNDGLLVQLRTSVIGTLTGLLFGADALFNNGRWLARGMARYVPFEGLDLKRLGLGMAIVSIALAVLNVVVVFVANEQFWLIYTTFLDIPLVIVAVWIVIFKSMTDEPGTKPHP